MDIYSRKSQWKWYLAAGGAAIIIISLLYTKYLADRLVERENQQAQQFAEAMRQIGLTDVDMNCDFTLPTRIIVDNTTIPVVVLDEAFQIEYYRNINNRNLDSMPIPEVRKALDRMVAEGADTILIIVS